MSSCVCGRSDFKDQKCIICNNCHRYIHLECTNLQQYQVNEVCVFYCQICRPYTGPSIFKAVTNSHRHNRSEENAEMLPIQTGTPDFISYLKKNTTIMEAKPNDLKKMRGQQLTLKELVISGFDKPILIETKDGLEIVTEPNFNFDTLLNYYSHDFLIDAMEVTRQIKIKLKLAFLVAQFKINHEERQDVYSFELDISQNSKLSDNFIPPRIVRKLSWVDLYWPNVPFKPLLSKYCFISMENSYSDFHIDIGGASAWYHVIKGEQIFYLIDPNSKNLNDFQTWMISSKTNEAMFSAKVENIFKIKVSACETILIPNGWIYSILSTQDSIVFGGYFLHSLSISNQLSINNFLQKLNKPELDFPAYELTNWYAAPNILKLAKESFKNQPPKHLSEGIEALIEKLREWLHKSKSKRNEGQLLVPKAVNCSKIIRDLNHCLRKNKKKSSKDVVDKEKIKNPLQKSNKTEEEKLSIGKETIFQLNPEETKIKDLVNNTDSEKSGSTNLKITFNMKLAQDVIRRSLDDPYDLNSEQNGRELMLIDAKNRPNKSKKRKPKDEDEITKLIQGRPQDENYIYLDLETPEENKKFMKKSNDEEWEPGTSSNKPKAKKITKNSDILSRETPSKVISKNENQVTESEQMTEKTTKKYKKGLATPKQRLAKKLKISR